MLGLTEIDIPKTHADLLKAAIRKNVQLVKDHLKEIQELFDSLPSEFNGIDVLTEERRAYYLRTFMERFELPLPPKAL